MIRLLAGLLTLAALAANASGLIAHKYINAGGLYSLSLTDGTRSIQVTVNTSNVTVDSRKTRGLSPSTNSITEITLSVDDNSLFVPRSAYSDLLDIKSMSLEKKGDYVLTFSCGDASESATTQIIFDEKRVKKRITIDNELGQVSEETTYKNVEWDPKS